MRYDYSLSQRSEDKWVEMHQSAREQRLARLAQDGNSLKRRGSLLWLKGLLAFGTFFTSVRDRFAAQSGGRR